MDQACLSNYLDSRKPVEPDTGGTTDDKKDGDGDKDGGDKEPEEPEEIVVDALLECFSTALAINYRGDVLPVTTDERLANELSANH